MTKIIELRPDRNLLNADFEKYQFCSDEIPIKCEKKLDAEILHVELSSSRDSWLEAKLFAFHNHLFKNPFDSSCWFVDTNGGVWKFMLTGALELVHTSKTIAAKSAQCLYNPSIAFASEDIFVISNGGGALEFLIKKDGCLKMFLMNDVEPAIVLDARFVNENSKIIVALYKIDEIKGKRFSRLIFLTYDYNANNEDQSQIVKLARKQTMKVKGSIDMVYFEKNGHSCHVISQDYVEFDYDSVNPVKTDEKKGNVESQIKIPKYSWSQDENSITVYVKTPEKYKSITTKVDVKPFNVSIAVSDMTLLHGETSYKLDSELTTWKLKDDTLEVELFKSESGLMWSELLKGDTGGEYIPNETLAAEIHSRLAHLCSENQESNTQGQSAIGFNSEQLEDCDFSGAENILQRINIDSHEITHMAMLGSSNRVLFMDKQSSNQVVCLRHDHDGCAWFLNECNNDNEWSHTHSYTFPGFGYIEASKTNKQFCISPPDGSWIAIVEHTRHAFVYEKPEKGSKVGKQRIVDFGIEVAVLGAISTNKYLIILTKNSLQQFQLYS
ncbi:nudC domain-containing protein 1 [Copidosoma floridanum]|uniref:nudC domain-containing protein 1 n=1 Tax=Copidosoma floridanum TaxID=29053 RepID=UPI0006C9DEB2|nr:nudC domain-containing protein 1 [Copidosoma floridanum]